MLLLSGVCCVASWGANQQTLAQSDLASQSEGDAHPVVNRIVEFRDGTLLNAQFADAMIPWMTITGEGKIQPQPRLLSETKSLNLVIDPATNQVARIRTLISKLGSRVFRDRESARDELAQTGSVYRQLIEKALNSSDPEVRWRVKEVLAGLDKNVKTVVAEYDRMNLGDGIEISGDVGQWDMRMLYRGNTVKLDRSKVLSIREGVLQKVAGEVAITSEFKTIEEYPQGALPPELVMVDFDYGPNGEEVQLNRSVYKDFVDSGCLFETSYDDSFIAIQAYPIEGRSGNMAAANEEPTYQGTTTIRFCMPGNENLPAGVHEVSLYVSWVSPGTTYLRAYGANGKLLGQDVTDNEGTDFLGFRSSTPIAYVQIEPTLGDGGDLDYAFDDVTFDHPAPLFEAGDPKVNSVVLKNGERLQSQVLSTQDGTMSLVGLSFGLPQLRVPLDEVAVIVPKRIAAATDDTLVVKADKRPFVQLRDGSILRPEISDDRISLSVASTTPVSLDQVVGLWGATTRVVVPPTKEWKDTKAFVMHGTEPIKLSAVKLGSTWISSDGMSGLQELDFSYSTSPTVWFSAPMPREANHGLIRMRNGEEYVLSQAGFQITSWTQHEVVVKYAEIETNIPFDQIRSLRLPR